MTSQQQPFFSIVIPTLNEEKCLPELLQNLADQTFQDFEVAHVDGRSEDKTIQKAASFKNKLDIKTLISKKRHVSYQRNLGGKKAQGKWIIFMDADNVLKPYYLQGLKYQIDKHPGVDIFTTWLDIESYPPKHKPTVRILNFGLELLSKFSPATFGALIGVRRNIFEQIKFDENIGFAEDWEFVKAVVEKGGTYACWQEPRYAYSFRRFEKDGLLKMSTVFVEGHFKRFVNGDWEEEYEKYPMEGGTYYDTEFKDSRLPFLNKLEDFLQNASKKQLKKARQIWKKISLSNDSESV